MDLTELQEALATLNNPDEDEAGVIIDRITLLFQGDLTSLEAHVFVAQVLNTQHGVFPFLRMIAVANDTGNKEFKKVFELIGYLATNFSSAVDKQAKNAVQWCLSMLHHSSTFSVDAIKWIELVVLNCKGLDVDWANAVDALKAFVTTEGKISRTLRQVIFSLLGSLCGSHPETMSSFSDWFLRVIIHSFHENDRLNKGNPDILIQGCFQGLNGYLKNFKLSNDGYTGIFSRLMTCCKLSGTKHTTHRAALAVFIEHGLIFAKSIYENRSFWRDALFSWISYNMSSEDQQLGLLAFDTYWKVISKLVVETDSKYVFDESVGLLELHLEKPFKHNVQMAISGYAEFREAYIKYSMEAELLVVVNSLVTLVEKSLKPQSSAGNNPEVAYRGLCLQAISKILPRLESLENLPFLSRLTVALIEDYPSVPPNFKKYSLTTLEKSFCELAWLDVYQYERYVFQVIYQGISRSCSHTLLVDAELLVEKEECVSYKSFLPLWVHLLTITSRAALTEDLVEERKEAGRVVYGSFVFSVLKIVSKLDLSLKTGLEDLSDPSLSLEATTPSDFYIFVNLLDLFEDVILASDRSHLEKWLPEILDSAIKQSRKKPLIAGFYKMIAVAFEVGVELGYFDDDYDFQELLIPFLSETAARVGRVKGELEIFSLKMILAAPVRAIEAILDQIETVILSAVRVGRGYPQFLGICITALDNWLAHLPLNQLEPILKKVLPHFDVLLQSVGDLNMYHLKQGNNLKIILKSGGKFKRKILGPTDSQLVTLQKQFLVFLGKLEPGLCTSLLKTPEPNLIGEGSKLVYNLPLPDMRAKVNLNILLPRIIELSLSCGDRSTRVTACELLHGAVLLGIARSRQPESNPNIFRKLLTASLSLSCDPDKVVSDLFHPLLLQITHYYSGLIQYQSKESAVLVEVLMEGITHPYESGLRDFSAQCLKEFLSWSLKQTTNKEDIVRVNTVAVIRTISSYSVHPDRCKRLGAAIAFNQVHSVVREQEDILNEYWLDLYHCFFRGLGMCGDEDDFRVLSVTFDKLLRPLKERSETFMTVNEKRRFPAELGQGLLQDVVLFTFEGCQNSNHYLRKVAQSSVVELVSRIPGASSLDAFLIGQGVDVGLELIDVPENPGEEWEERVLGAMDYTNWLTEITPFELTAILSESTLVDAAAEFLELTLGKSEIHEDELVCLLKFLARVTHELSPDSLKHLAQLLFKPGSLIAEKNVFEAFQTVLKKCSLSLDLWSNVLSAFPPSDQRYLIKQLKKRNIPYLMGLELLLTSSTLNFEYSGMEILKALETRLFAQRGRKMVAMRIETPLLKCFKRLLPHFLKFGVGLDALMEILTDETEIEDNGKATKKGDVWFRTFEETFVDFILAEDSSLEVLLQQGNLGIKWILLLLQNLDERPFAAKRVQRGFIWNVLIRWQTVINIPQVKIENLLDILKVISKVVKFGYLQKTDSERWLCKIMQQRLISASAVTTFFEILPQFSSRPEAENTNLEFTLKQFRKLHREFFGDLDPVTPANYPVVLAMERGLARSVKITGSLVALQFLAENISQKTDLLEDAKSNFAISFPDEHILKALHKLSTSLHSGLLLEESFNNVCDWATSILRKTSEKVVFQFFVAVLPQLSAIMQETHKDGTSAEQLIAKKISAVRLLDALYFRTSKVKREEIEKAVVATSRECAGVYKKLIEICYKEIVVPIRSTPNAKRLLRQLNCDCVKLMCTVVTQFSDERPYKAFLFRDFLSRNVVDPAVEYKLGMDFDRLPERKKILTSIRRENSSNVVDPSLAYAHSLPLCSSSLSEDIQKFDLTDMTVQKYVQPYAEVLSIELEMDDLNKHDIMADICAVIHHMSRKGIFTEGSKPCWLNYFLNVLSDPMTSKNAKILVLKMMHNLDSALKPFAEECSAVILEAALSLFRTINYLVCDLVVMVMSWKPKLEGRHETLTKLIEMILGTDVVMTKNIMRVSLGYVKGIIECWKDVVDGPKLVQMLLNKTFLQNNLINYTSLTFASVLLGNNIVPFNTDEVIQLGEWLIDSIKRDKVNGELAAGVLGLALSRFPTLYNDRQNAIKSMEISILYRIHKFYPEVSSLVVTRLISGAWHRDLTTRCLEMLVSHFNRSPKQHFEEALIKKLICDQFKESLLPILEGTLKLTLALSGIFSEDSLATIGPLVVKQGENDSPKIRSLVCDILITVMKRYLNKFELFPAAKLILLRGLNDVDEEMQKKCEDYWFDSEKCGRSSPERLLWVLQELYNADAEADFVEYACKMILRSSTNTVDYNLDIFEHPLEKCSYVDYSILVSHRARYATLAPMFAPSIASELSQINFDRPSQSENSLQIKFRATAQSLAFAPTQADSSQAHFSRAPVPTQMDDGFKRPMTSARHLKSAKSVGIQFAKRAVEKRDREESQAIERMKDRDGSVKLVRSYRKGDYPDIQIKHASFITTLLGLLKRDSQVAKEMFTCLFSALTDQFQYHEKKIFCNSVGRAFETMLDASQFSDSIFLATVFQISLSNEITLGSEVVCQAAKATGLLSLGLLLLERNISNSDVGETPLKRRRGPEGEMCKEWLFLAQLFQTYGDIDAVRGIFLDKLQVEGNVAKAIHYETALDWAAAARSYEEVFNQGSESDDRRYFYDQAYYNCLENLSNWPKMAESIKQTVSENLEMLFNDPWSRDILLPRYVRSKMITSLKTNQNSDFQDFVLAQNSTILTAKFPAEVAVAHWLSEHTPEALFFLNEAYVLFMRNWSHINEWDSSLKLSCLAGLQTLSELQGIMSVVSASVQDSALLKVANEWKLCQPTGSSKLVDWDIRLAMRARFVAHVSSLNSEETLEEVEKNLLASRLAMVKAAIHQENSIVALRYLEATKSQEMDLKDNCLWKFYRNLKKMVDVRKSGESPEKKLEDYLSVWNSIEDMQNKVMETEDYGVTMAHINLSLLRVVSEVMTLTEENKVSIETLGKYPKNKSNISECWLKYADESISLFGDSSEWVTQRGDIYVQMAKFHRKHSKNWSEVLKALLQGMASNNVEARHMFGCVLTMEDESEPWDVAKEAKNVPTWMYLFWRQQLLASMMETNMTLNKIKLVRAVLKKMAVEYPNALSHGLRLSRENFSEALKNNRFVVGLTAKVLSNQKEELFVKAIAKIASPSMKFTYYLRKALSHASKEPCDKNMVISELKLLRAMMSDPSNGAEYKKLERYTGEIDEMLDFEGDVKLLIESLLKKIPVVGELPPRLNSYCTILSDRQMSDRTIEVPGQYDGDCEPRPSNHVRISGFSSSLTPLPSIRRPFKLIMIGDDAKEYPFLVKFGEDLRQDERIQQVFALMRGSLQGSLEGYSVVPLSSAHGLIQWVEETRSLKSLAFCGANEDQVVKEERRLELEVAQEEHMRFLCRNAVNLRDQAGCHMEGYEKAKDSEVMDRYQRLVSKFRPDTLRRSFWRLSVSSEQFVSLRACFAQSVGVMSVAHWVLGVGDRHLENILVSTRTGRVLGIDFGCAFGFATQALRLPEIVPFRLTPQMVQVLTPLNESGWLKQTMIRTLKSLRVDPSVFLSVLEAFVQEPCENWEEHAQRQVVDAASWSARQKIEDVEGKLKGSNPVVTFERDLFRGHQQKKAYPFILKVLQGKIERNVRATLPEEGLSSEEQVSCLLDLAMDPLVLGHMYVGWMSWI